MLQVQDCFRTFYPKIYHFNRGCEILSISHTNKACFKSLLQFYSATGFFTAVNEIPWSSWIFTELKRNSTLLLARTETTHRASRISRDGNGYLLCVRSTMHMEAIDSQSQLKTTLNTSCSCIPRGTGFQGCSLCGYRRLGSNTGSLNQMYYI